jgi:hypothetical protein
MNIWVDLAQLVAGAAAVVAIAIAILDRRRQEYNEEFAQASKVTAWRAYAEAEGESEQIQGVVIENQSTEVAIQIDVKVGKLTQNTTDEHRRAFAAIADEATTGVRLALLPSGTYFIPRADGEWKAQREVDDVSGARRVLIPESDKPGAKRVTYQLYPVTKVETNAPAVYLLRFLLGDRRWWRDERGILHEDAIRRAWRESRRLASPTTWDGEFKTSTETNREDLTKRSDFTKYAWDGDGKKHSKLETINLIAQWWAKDQGIRSRDDFERRFGTEIGHALPERASQFGGDALLTTTPATVRNDGNPKQLVIELDDTLYGIRWGCGFKTGAEHGLTVHKPIIDYFIATHGAPARSSS